ncbi:MAG TPA: amino acid permease [Bryobacteraceae bacterium]|nr:amino acid permease [Bryobacteraceae bacterium]
MSFVDWLLADLRLPKGVGSEPEAKHAWWRVMCLTGVDYFSTLGYQPGIAFLAAGILSPIATLVLVLVTLGAALPVYRRVAEASPNGQGSIAMLENLFPQWTGKSFVLVLLGFATTDFIITMTLSAADAAAHFTKNPFTPPWMKSQMAVTLVLLAILGAIFLKGFREAIGVAVVLVGIYLFLNSIVTGVALWHLLHHPQLVPNWVETLFGGASHPLRIIGASLLLFPKLALGLSGFETGVAVMPLIEGKDVAERIKNTKKLLLTAALIMSVFLIATSFVTTLLIPPAAFKDGGEANGRALAYLGHRYLGNTFGSIYDISTILILAFAGASAMAGLLNLIPRYLPRFGMAPEWARSARPLVLVFLSIAFTVTILFHADVDAQGGAYATGVLVLMTSAAIAVSMSVRRSWLQFPFALVSVIFVYTTAVNIYERPEGIKISSFFIFAIVVTSLVSRAMRSTELRIHKVELDQTAREVLAEDTDQVIHLVARKPREETEEELDRADRAVRYCHNLSPDERVYFMEVEKGDASTFETTLMVCGRRVGRHSVLCASSPTIANAIAALLIHLEQTTGHVPHAYFSWTEGNPVGNLFRFVFLGSGDAAPLVHEVLRRAIPDMKHRPIVHVS